VGYKEASLYLDGALDLQEAIRRHKNANHRLVRRQAAWFKTDDPRIRWLEAGDDAPARCVALVKDWLEARQKPL
jgi:tRNA A37 N6-isopentenylltransferase MiaA